MKQIRSPKKWNRWIICRVVAWIGVCVIGFVSVAALPHQVVHGGISSCTVTVAPTSVNVSSTTNLTFSVTNHDTGNEVQWIKISVPNANFTIIGYSISGWSGARNDTTLILNGDAIAPDDTLAVIVQTTSGSQQASSADWGVQTADNPSGDDPIPCTGSLGVSISGSAPDTTPPTISDIVVSDVTDSSVKITWTTNESSTSSVDYGTTDAYGSNTADASMVTSHSLTVSSLSANTTYYYNVKSTDAASNTGQSGDNTFVTAKAGTTGSTQTGTTTTITRLVTPTPTPTPKPDLTPPSITIATKLAKSYTSSPKIEGSAKDPSGVGKIQYSLDDGKNWTAVDTVSSSGSISTLFDFTPESLVDDTYLVKVRAWDTKGNIGTTKAVNLVIDRLPPQVGATFFSIGPQELTPDEYGRITTVENMDTKITLSAIGGPTEILITTSLISENSQQPSSIPATETLPLVKNIQTGLWTGILKFPASGQYRLTAQSVDGADNRTTRTLNTIHVVPTGHITVRSTGNENLTDHPLEGAAVSVYYREPLTRQFILWDGAPYGQENPQKTDAQGSYMLYLPSGTYYLRVEHPLYVTLTSEIFTITANQPVVSRLTLTPKQALSIGSWVIPLPSFENSIVPIDLLLPVGDFQVTQLERQPVPVFSLDTSDSRITDLDLRGKPTVLTFINTWHPQVSSQLEALEDLSKNSELRIMVIVPQESQSAVSLFRKRGSYTIPMIADPDGILVEPFRIMSMPTHVFIDRKGNITGIKFGILQSEDLIDNGSIE